MIRPFKTIGRALRKFITEPYHMGCNPPPKGEPDRNVVPPPKIGYQKIIIVFPERMAIPSTTISNATKMKWVMEGDL